MIVCIASVKKRPIPDSPSHPSVGTEGTKAQRETQQKPPPDYILTLDDIEPLILSEDTMRFYGFPIEIPSTPGSEQPHAYGAEMTCDRCGTPAIIKHDQGLEDCQFHWGRPIRSMGGGGSSP